MASGSVDQTGTYVFEVEPQGTDASGMKIANYWSVADGNDTMYSLWNPTEKAQDLVVTFDFGDGSGQYVLPVHLDGKASAQIDLMMIMEMGKGDPSGAIFPKPVREGSLTVADAKDRHNKIWVVVAGGVFNVKNATCGVNCVNCCGVVSMSFTPNTFACPVGSQISFLGYAIDCQGRSLPMNWGNWSSSNPSVATVDGTGFMSCLSPGSVTISEQLNGVGSYSGQICAPQPFCPTGNPTLQSSGTVTAPPPSKLSVYSDPGNVKSNACPHPSDNGLVRRIQYQISSTAGPTGQVAIQENFGSHLSTNTCGTGSPTPSACSSSYVNSQGVFTDQLATNACAPTNQSCGFSITPDQWQYCGGSSPATLGSPTYVIHWNNITVNGSTKLANGTVIP